MSANQFAVPKGTDVIFTSRAAAERDIARTIGINVAGMDRGTEIVTFREPVKGDPDACLKMLKNMQPHGLAKSEVARDADEVIDLDDPNAALGLIKTAHGTALNVEDLQRGYGGREQAALAKKAATSTSERVSKRLQKAIDIFEAMSLRQMNRRAV